MSAPHTYHVIVASPAGVEWEEAAVGVKAAAVLYELLCRRYPGCSVGFYTGEGREDFDLVQAVVEAGEALGFEVRKWSIA